jgi:hypothetical protein
VQQIALLAGSLTDPGGVLDEVVEKSWRAGNSPSIDRETNREEAKQAMSASFRLPEAARASWDRLRGRLDCPF